MLRRTKIVTTLGPATDKPGVLEKLINAGANVVRLNFSHGKSEDHIERAQQVREIAARLGKHVAILGDLQGPKIRVARFQNGAVELQDGAAFILDASLPSDAGDEHQVGLDYKDLPKDLIAGDVLLLDDGRMRLTVERVEGSCIHTIVTVGGKLSNNKGINRLGGGLSAAALTDKDYRDIEVAAEIDVDILAVSFPRSGADLQLARALLNKAGCDGAICAKIERAETVATDSALDDLIEHSDVVMVARGDLGVEIGDAQLVGKQKRIIKRARELNKVVITATQMMESMIDNSMPTRAEVMDVANAVLDGTDAVMLSAETAAGKYPVETVKAMADICRGAEEYPALRLTRDTVEEPVTSVAQATALAAMYTANHLAGVKAIIALTESGHTAKLMSRIHTDLPIFALSRHQHSLNRANLYRGVYPTYFDSTKSEPQNVLRDAIELIRARGLLEKGDMVIITHGDVMETIGKTNTSKILQV
ncbi:pyruvate kinase [Aliidiomarina haloalkalitolerans]|uniref:Pyruvate kinase n=1 Tax=Aliidiomarina haloalkalitolerans TaxID=859059 RepID=A0A432VYF2_9GAMM|nr:pyruvate kinase [Aliidiomarina haloalkalitolerans]RUO21638.1 pyruvate kinase [Aliidiomarina haloalkalitolerans]